MGFLACVHLTLFLALSLFSRQVSGMKMAGYFDKRVGVSVSVSVCLTASISPELHVRSSPNFCACYLWPLLIPLLALRCVLYFRFHTDDVVLLIMARNKRSEKSYTQSDSTGGSMDCLTHRGQDRTGLGV